MKDYLASLVGGKDALAARNIAREYLQARILSSLQRAGAMSCFCQAKMSAGVVRKCQQRDENGLKVVARKCQHPFIG